jgi:hypothetical protein
LRLIFKNWKEDSVQLETQAIFAPDFSTTAEHVHALEKTALDLRWNSSATAVPVTWAAHSHWRT